MEGCLWGVLEKIVDAAKGSVDLLAFIVLVVLGAWVQTQGNDIIATAAFVAICYAIWIVGRVLLLSVQSKERLRDFRENAKVKALDVLMKHADANEINDIVKKLTKDDGHDDR